MKTYQQIIDSILDNLGSKRDTAIAKMCAAEIISNRVNRAVNDAPEILRMLVLSTGHLKPETARMLDEDVPIRIRQQPIKAGWGQGIDHGYLVWSGWGDNDVDDTDVPEEVLAACKVARGLDCEYLKYDCDGELLVDLGDYIYEW